MGQCATKVGEADNTSRTHLHHKEYAKNQVVPDEERSDCGSASTASALGVLSVRKHATATSTAAREDIFKKYQFLKDWYVGASRSFVRLSLEQIADSVQERLTFCLHSFNFAYDHGHVYIVMQLHAHARTRTCARIRHTHTLTCTPPRARTHAHDTHTCKHTHTQHT